ncbi:SUMO ligase siz1 [Irineochytrium annulatum]|nr:SUMO ligase siz1 [Irineochytrium annulatum]
MQHGPLLRPAGSMPMSMPPEGQLMVSTAALSCPHLVSSSISAEYRRIDLLHDDDFAALGTVVGISPGLMKCHYLTVSFYSAGPRLLPHSTVQSVLTHQRSNMGSLTMPKIKAICNVVCDRFRVRRFVGVGPTKASWVNALAVFLYSPQVGPRPVLPSLSALAQNAASSFHQLPSHGVPGPAVAPPPSVVPPRPQQYARFLPNNDVKGDPRTMAGAGFGLTQPAGAEPQEDLSYAAMVKIDMAMKHFPPSFHHYHDFMAFITHYDIGRFANRVTFPFRVPAFLVPTIIQPPSDARTRCYLCLFSAGLFEPNSVGVSIDHLVVKTMTQKPNPKDQRKALVFDMSEQVRKYLREDGDASVAGKRFVLTMQPRIPMASEVLAVIILAEKLDKEQFTAKFYEHALKLKAPDINPLNPIHLFPGFRRYGDGAQRQRDTTAIYTTLMDLKAAEAGQRAPKIESGEKEDDVEVGDTVVSFQDVLSFTRIQHPAKGLKCKHAQAFDAVNLLESMEGVDMAEVWKCTVCNSVLHPMDVTLDLPFFDLLTKYERADRCVIRADGTDAPALDALKSSERSHSAVNPATALFVKKGSSSSPAPAKRPVVEVICLDTDEEEEPVTKKPKVGAGAGAIGSSSVASTKKGPVGKESMTVANSPAVVATRSPVGMTPAVPSRLATRMVALRAGKAQDAAASRTAAAPLAASPFGGTGSASTPRSEPMAQFGMCALTAVNPWTGLGPAAGARGSASAAVTPAVSTAPIVAIGQTVRRPPAAAAGTGSRPAASPGRIGTQPAAAPVVTGTRPSAAGAEAIALWSAQVGVDTGIMGTPPAGMGIVPLSSSAVATGGTTPMGSGTATTGLSTELGAAAMDPGIAVGGAGAGNSGAGGVVGGVGPPSGTLGGFDACALKDPVDPIQLFFNSLEQQLF